tara:strand:+ start:641 stop:1519 length:879 start_codon:yes stop_codon:yes gene_type:complete
MQKVCILDGWHIKNKFFLVSFFKNYNTDYQIVNNLNDANIIISPGRKIDAENYPKKKFLFGPHFSVTPPNNIVRSLNNIHNNSIYIQPSQYMVDMWKHHFKLDNIPLLAMPFGVDTQKFNSISIERTNILLYFKERDPKELLIIENFLKQKGLTYKIFNYEKKYKEDIYLSYLKTCKYGIWLGRNESQGFALQEALSCNVPLIVWDVKLYNQHYPERNGPKKDLTCKVTSIPYWDQRCGEYFYTENELEETFNKFINKIDSYNPRNYILENVSIEACYKKWDNLLKSKFNFS